MTSKRAERTGEGMTPAGATKLRVVVAGTLPAAGLDLLRDRFTVEAHRERPDGSWLRDHAPGATAIVVDPTMRRRSAPRHRPGRSEAPWHTDRGCRAVAPGLHWSGGGAAPACKRHLGRPAEPGRRELPSSRPYLVFMAAAGVIAAFGVIYASTTLIVGAMAISPDMLPITAAATALVLRRWRLSARAVATLIIGLGCACVVGAMMTFALECPRSPAHRIRARAPRVPRRCLHRQHLNPNRRARGDRRVHRVG